jgi:hypothetical protein
MEHGVMIVQASPEPGREREFERFYNDVHVPEILATPGFVRARRYRTLLSPRFPASPADEWRSHLAVYDIAAESLADSYSTLLERMTSGQLTWADVFSSDAPYRSQVFEQILDTG